MTGIETNRRKFAEIYQGLLEAGLSILEKTDRLYGKEGQILQTFLTEGYNSFLKKYEKTSYQIPDLWMEKRARGLTGGKPAQKGSADAQP
jgi:hypothetical protein